MLAQSVRWAQTGYREVDGVFGGGAMAGQQTMGNSVGVGASATRRHHRDWVGGTRSALVAAEYAVLVVLLAAGLLAALYLMALASL